MEHVLRKEDGDVVRNALEFDVTGRRKRGRPTRTWRKQVEDERLKVGLNLKDAHNRTKWRERVRAIFMRSIRLSSTNGDNTGLWHHHYHHLVTHTPTQSRKVHQGLFCYFSAC